MPIVMEQAKITFLDIPEGPLDQAYDDRITDWHEDGDRILRLADQYEEEYRQKVCAQCSIKQKKKRKCTQYEIDGAELRTCNHMESAIDRRLKKVADAHLWSHPFLAEAKRVQDAGRCS